jgi:uncharacterized protein YbcI
LENKSKESIAGELLITDKGQKNELEQRVKGKIAYFIKTYTGKGPRIVQVSIQGSDIKVKAEEVLTLLEINTASNNRNNSLVDNNRKIFYKENKLALENLVNEVINSKVSLLDVQPDSANNMDTMRFRFCM